MLQANVAALLRDNTKTVVVQFRRILRSDIAPPDTLIAEDVPSFVPKRVNVTPSRSQKVAVASVLEEEPEQREYTFIDTMDCKAGDVVLTDTKHGIQIGIVQEAHDCLDIQPGDTREYRYIVGKVDGTAFNNLMAENKQIEDLWRQSYQTNIRANLRSTLLGSLGEGEQRLQLEHLLASKKP